MKLKKEWCAAVLVAVRGLAASGVLFAQTAPATPNSAQSSGSPELNLNEVVVTATRRPQRLQDVPLSVTVVSGDVLNTREVLDVTDLPQVSPSLTYSGTNPAGGGFTDRGIGIGNFSPAVEQSMAVVVDGIVMAIQGAGIGLLSDIERIEVLNGPQGTTFGKNASAGVINIVTQRPSTSEFSANAHVEYGGPSDRSLSDNSLAVMRGSVNLPLSSTIAARLSGFDSRDSGNVYNVTQGKNVNSQYQQGGRANVLWKVTDNLDIDTIADYRYSHGDCCYSTFLHLDPGSLLSRAMTGTGVIPGQDNYEVALDGDDYIHVTDQGLSTQADYRIGGYTLTAIGGARSYNTAYNMDTDNTPLPLFSVNAVKYYYTDQSTGELRLTSPSGGIADFVAGLYFFKKHSVINGGSYVIGTFGEPLPPGVLLAPAGQLALNFSDRTEAAYGQTTFHVTSRLGLIGGLRYTHENYGYVTTQTAIPGYLGLPPNYFVQVAGQPTADNVSWRVGLQYTFSRDLMSYATVTRGYKGPTPLLTALSSGSQYGLSKPEIPTDYEVGVKSTWLRGRMVVNADVFDEVVQDFQTSVFDPTTNPPAFRVTNAGELDSKGVELQASALPFRGLSLSGGVTYDDAYYGSFTGNGCYAGQTVAEGCMPVPGTASSVFNSTGHPVDGVSKWVFSTNADYEQPVSEELALFYNVNYYYRGRTGSSNDDPIAEVPGYGSLGGKIGIGNIARNWLVSFYVRNALNEHPLLESNPLFGEPGEVLLYHPRDGERLIGLSIDVER